MKLLSIPRLLAILLIFTAGQANSEVTLPKLFSSHMVLQRDMPLHIWGDAAPAERVTVSLQDSSVSDTADELGHWSIYLSSRPAGGPFILSVHASNTLQFDDIFIGDLWMASGQSNMEIPLKGYNPATQIQDSTAEIAGASHPQIRLFLVQHDVSDYPLEDVKTVAGWSQCTPESAANFSAVAYFFARALQQKQHVAIGLIDSTWGGTPAEAWTSLDTLGNDPSLMPVFATRAGWMDREMTEERLVRLDAEIKAQGKVPPRRYWHPDPVSWRPATLYNAMIAPFTRLPIRGVIWYQGEANSAPQMAPLYSRLFPALIQDWRTQWRQSDLPFLFVQLSAYGNNPTDNWGLIRDAQRRTLHLVNTGMAVTIDIGNEHNVHPANKQAVGDRLALLARKIVYQENLVSSGPLFRYAYPQGGSMHVLFDNADGLTSKSTPESFEVAGADGAFAPGIAKIEGNTITVSSPTVPNPQYVRYAWLNYPPVDHPANLYNSVGLPASTFTSYPMP